MRSALPEDITAPIKCGNIIANTYTYEIFSSFGNVNWGPLFDVLHVIDVDVDEWVIN